MMETYNSKLFFPAAFTKIFISIWMLSIKLNSTCIFRYLEYEMLLIFLCGIKTGYVLLEQFAQLTSHLTVVSRGLRGAWKVEWTFLFHSLSIYSLSFIPPFLELYSVPSSFAFFFPFFPTTLFEAFLYQPVGLLLLVFSYWNLRHSENISLSIDRHEALNVWGHLVSRCSLRSG
jgi:hypothetical protein